MIHHDLAHWPLVISRMEGTATLDEQMAFYADWTSWLDRGARFATLRIVADADALQRPEGGAKEAKAWLQAHADRIKSQVMGMATVVPGEVYEEVSRMNAEKLFGVPARTFATEDDAVAWISSSVLGANEIVIASDTIRATLQRLRNIHEE